MDVARLAQLLQETTAADAQRIAAAEREAVDDVRNRAVNAATNASRKLIAEKHDAAADKALADTVIAGI